MNICRSGLYYEPAEESKENQEIMKIMDMYFMEHPTTGKRGFHDYIRLRSYKVNIKRFRRLMDVMGIESIYPRKCLSKVASASTYIPICSEAERFWRFIKQDYIYTHTTDDVMELRNGIDEWIRFYNYERPHQELGGSEKSNRLTVKNLEPL